MGTSDPCTQHHLLTPDIAFVDIDLLFGNGLSHGVVFPHSVSAEADALFRDGLFVYDRPIFVQCDRDALIFTADTTDIAGFVV